MARTLIDLLRLNRQFAVGVALLLLVAAFSCQSLDHGVTGFGSAAPSSRMSSTCSLKKHRWPLIFGHSGIGSG